MPGSGLARQQSEVVGLDPGQVRLEPHAQLPPRPVADRTPVTKRESRPGHADSPRGPTSY